ncbi:MAG: hypothetical protein E7042_09565 [Lentisphaerae bacterium]|nr:hypothetical protein [Lentisphaerota bacterium]
MKRRLLLGCAVIAWAAAAQPLAPLSRKYLTGAWVGNSCVSIPRAKITPVLDGKADDKEWNDALRIAGFSAKDRLVPERSGFAAFKHDGKYLYCLVRTSAKNNDPGGGLTTTAQGRDSNSFDDDSIEFVFSGDGSKVYHLIFNDNCSLYDREVVLEPKAVNAKWNIQDYQAHSLAESGWWTFEVKFALAEIGAKANGLKFNVARNWSGYGPSALNSTSSHTDLSKAITGVFGKDLPVVQMDDIPNAAAGEWNIRFTADNHAGRNLVLAVMLRDYAYPKVNGKVTRQVKEVVVEEKAIAPGKKVEISCKYDANRDIHRLSAVLYDARSRRVYFSRMIAAKKEVFTGRQPVSGVFSINGFGTGLYRHYPGYGKAVFEITPGSSASGKSIELFADGKKVELKSEQRKLIGVVPLKARSCNVSCVVKANGSAAGKTQTLCRIPYKKWKWQNHNYGKERVLLEPFAAIKAAGSDGIATLRSQYRFTPAGLPGVILADKKAIFAGVPVSEIVVDGKLFRFEKGKVAVTVAPDGLDARTVAEACAGGISLKTVIHSEYDNFNVHTMTLSGVKGKTVSRWTVKFPFREDEAWLFHAVSNMIRRNPSGEIPQGDGCVWDGSKLFRATAFGQETLHPAFVPYIWLGGLERGMAWFADTSLGMKLDRKKSAVRIVRSQDQVWLEIDFVNRPVKLRDGHKIEFGTQATPVKPIDQRVVNITYDALGVGVPSRPNELTVSEHILGYPFRWSKYPVDEDWTLVDILTRAAESPDRAAVAAAVDKYMKKHGKKIRQMYMKAGNNVKIAEKFEKSRPTWIKLNFGGKRSSFPAKYSDPRLAYTADPVTEYFKAEWFNPSVQNYFGALRTSLTPSYLDFILYGYAKEFEHGIKGCYLDDTFIMPDTNPYTLAAIDEDGELHSNTGLFAMRELVKRISVLQHLKGHSPRVLQVHMTNAQLVPVFSFATSQLGWEADFGEKPLQERYRHDFILAESTGLQVGNAPLALGGVVRKTTPQDQWKPKFDYLTRTLLAMTMPYGVGVKLRASPQDASRKVVLAAQDALGRFGIADKECVFEPFFDPAKSPKEIRGQNLMISAYARQDRKLLVIGNKSKTPQQFHFHGKFSAIRDYETGKALADNDRTVNAYDFRLIEIVK